MTENSDFDKQIADLKNDIKTCERSLATFQTENTRLKIQLQYLEDMYSELLEKIINQ
jgi:septal ring factor EnvC (AmiA/AmiB activator)